MLIGKPIDFTFARPSNKPEVHELVGRILVIDHEQTAIGAAVDGQEADKIVVVPKLRFLRGARWLRGIECGGPLEHGIAPSDENIRIIPGSDVMRRVGPGSDLCEVKPRLDRIRRIRRPGRDGNSQRRDRARHH